MSLNSHSSLTDHGPKSLNMYPNVHCVSVLYIANTTTLTLVYILSQIILLIGQTHSGRCCLTARGESWLQWLELSLALFFLTRLQFLSVWALQLYWYCINETFAKFQQFCFLIRHHKITICSVCFQEHSAGEGGGREPVLVCRWVVPDQHVVSLETLLTICVPQSEWHLTLTFRLDAQMLAEMPHPYTVNSAWERMRKWMSIWMWTATKSLLIPPHIFSNFNLAGGDAAISLREDSCLRLHANEAFCSGLPELCTWTLWASCLD